jgi:20S proteasome subunit beta 1
MDLNGASTSQQAEPHTGTTIVACRYKDGVVLGADGRVSTGNYISNRASNKIYQLADHVYLLRSGSAADTQAIGDYGASWLLQRPQTCCAPAAAPHPHAAPLLPTAVRYFVEQLKAELQDQPNVRTVANLVALVRAGIQQRVAPRCFLWQRVQRMSHSPSLGMHPCT